MARQRDCDYCGQSYAYGNSDRQDVKSVSARFCSDTCRYASANERKKLYRQANASAEYFSALLNTANSTQDKQNKVIADRLIDALQSFATHHNLADLDGMVSAIKQGKVNHE